MDQETREFIEERENKIGGKMSYRTYCTWYNDSSDNLRDRGVFIYIINNVVYYEDFENQPSFFGILLKTSKRRKKQYKKFERSFSINDVDNVSTIKKSNALKNKCEKKANKIQQVFNQTVVCVKLKNKEILFFEPIDKKEFKEKLLGEV